MPARRAHGASRLTIWLPLIVVFPFVVLFFVTAIPRIGVPFELEWNEGQSAEQALRFARGEPLYPAPESGWVPYMYAPLYHIALGMFFKLTGDPALWQGRLISFVATLMTMLGAAHLVFEFTRRRAAAILAGAMVLLWYRAGGFWLDLVRVDAFAQPFAVWGVWWCIRRGGAWQSRATGLVLLFLAALTKQPFAALGVVMAATMIAREGRRAMVPICIVAFFAVNALKLLADAGNPYFFHYVLTNSINHLSWWPQLIPGGADPASYFGEGEKARGVVAFVRDCFTNAPAVWREGLQHVWVVAFASLAACAFAISRARCAAWLAPQIAALIALAAVSTLGYAKFGGYVNNFLPLHLWLAVLAPAAWIAARDRMPRKRRPLLDVSFGCVLIAQIAAPWPGGVTLAWKPADQWPKSADREAYTEWNAWLEEKAASNEPVWPMHHQFFSSRLGHPSGPNVDMVRCATWAGDPVPESMIAAISSRQFTWLVLDASALRDEWLAPGIENAIRANYERAGTLPFMEDANMLPLMMPLTGAPVRPVTLYRRKEPTLNLPPDTPSNTP